MSAPEEDITILLQASREPGAADARDRLFRAVEQQLRVLARSLRANSGGDPAIQTTVLVDEAFLRLVNDPTRDWDNRVAFYRLAYGVMRRVLADHGRRRRPGPLPDEQAARLPGAPSDPAAAVEGRELVDALAGAITRLEAEDPDSAAVFMLCFFQQLPSAEGFDPRLAAEYAGEKVPLRELAAVRDQSVSTVHRTLARALDFLQQQLVKDHNPWA